jgi:hypothetical protein
MDVLAPAKRASGWMLKLAIERLALLAIALALGGRLCVKCYSCVVAWEYSTAVSRSGRRVSARVQQPSMRSCSCALLLRQSFDFPILNIARKDTTFAIPKDNMI